MDGTGGNSGRRTGTAQFARRLPFVLAGVFLLTAIASVFRPRSTAILPPARPVSGSQPFATILCRFSDSSALLTGDIELASSYYDRLMVGGEGSVDDFWRQTSYGAIDLAGSKAFGWFELGKPWSAYVRPEDRSADLDALARDCSTAADSAAGTELYFPAYVGINLVFSECIDRPRGGAMDLTLDARTRNYRVTWLCRGDASSQEIVAHEMGHSFGLTHSEDSQGYEYGNHWDLMSNAGVCAAITDLGTTAQQPIAYNKDALGWIARSDKYTARRSGVETIQLDYLERAPGSPAGYVLAEIPLPGGRFYTLEARGRLGYDAALPSAGVLIHEIDPQRASQARLVSGAPMAGPNALLSSHGGWPVGSAFIDRENNVAVSIDQQVDAGFVVTLYSGALPWPEEASLQAADDSGATVLQWRQVPRQQKYEIGVTRVTAGSEAEAAPEWGATFVSEQPFLRAALPEGRYRWQVRVLPAGPWAPPQFITAGRTPRWQPVQQVAHLDSPLTVAPVVSAQASGEVNVAWAEDAPQASLSVARAVLQGDTWAVRDVFQLAADSQSGLALSFTPAGQLQASWPTESVDGAYATYSPAVALDAGGRVHTIWAGAGRGTPGIFSAIVDAKAPSAGPYAAPTRAVQPIPVTGDGSGAAKYAPSIAVDGDGNAQAVWIDTRDGRSAVYSASQGSAGEWSRGERLSSLSEAAQGRPGIAVSTSGSAYAVWQGNHDCGGAVPLAEISFAEQPAGHHWQAPVTLAVADNQSELFDPVVAANDAGEVFVAWGEAKAGTYRILSAYRSIQGEWEPPRLAAEGRTDAVPISLSLAVNPRGDAYLTWAETQVGRSTVRFAAAR